MSDMKFQIAAKLTIAFIIAVISYVLLSPILGFYGSYMPSTFICNTSNTWCALTQPLMIVVLPILAIVFVVWSVIEVFGNALRF